MDKEPFLQLSRIDQVGVAVKNLDDAVAFMQERFGIELLVLPMPRARAYLRGKEVEFVTRIGIAKVGSIDLEFMEIVEGDHLVREFLEQRGPGIHHLGIYVDDLEEAVNQWCEAGGSLVQKTAHPGGIGTAYLDTEGALGSLYIELIKT